MQPKNKMKIPSKTVKPGETTGDRVETDRHTRIQREREREHLIT